jgi:hypothetical protein
MSFESIILDLMDGCVRVLDAIEGDCDRESEGDCCGAYDDCGGASVTPPWCPDGTAADHDDAEPDEDAEASPAGYLTRAGAWRGQPWSPYV